MDPIPETAHLLATLDATSEADLTATLQRMARDVAQLVPSLVGLSLTLGEHGLTLTLVASDEVASALDGVQHLFGGPELDALDGVDSAVPDVLSEERWAVYAHAASNNGVRSSLSLPLGGAGVLTGALTLYAALPRAFSGLEAVLRRTLGIQGGLSVANGDVPFRSLADAREGPSRLEDHDMVERAVGFVAASRKVGIAEARRLLHDAAQRSSVEVALLARVILHVPESRPAGGRSPSAGLGLDGADDS